MKIAIMQPYLFPYIGYFQLINAVDKFIVYNNVNYIKRGWVNRNRILINGQPHLFTIPIKQASQNKKINEVQVSFDEQWKRKFLRKLQIAYKRAPYFESTYLLVSEIINESTDMLTEWFLISVKKILSYLNVTCLFQLSSEIKCQENIQGQDRIIELCEHLGAKEYINMENGRNLYDGKAFLEHNIQLKFLVSHQSKYKQFHNHFIPKLSIIDVLMFNDPSTVQFMLTDYSLIPSLSKNHIEGRG